MSDYQNKYNRAVSAYLLEDYDLSRKMIDQLLNTAGENPLFLILSGNIHEAQQAPDKAIGEYKKAINLAPDNPEAYNNLGVAYKNSGDFAKAEVAFLQAAELAPERPDISYNLGNLFKKSGSTESAEKWYRRSIEQDPSYIRSYNNLGTIYEQSNDYEKAEEVYRQGLSIDGNNATLHYNLGITYQDRGNMDQARSQYEESLKFRPGWTPSLSNLGEVLQNQGHLDEAQQKFSQLLDKDPDNIRAISNMGTIHAQKGDNEKARQFFKKALTKDPSYKAATFNLKQLYMSENSLQEALEELNKLANYHPEDMNIRLQIASILTKQGRYKEAEKVYNHILERQNDSLEAYRCLAELYALEKRPDLVRSCVIEIFKIDPSDKSILLTLSEAYLRVNRGEDALKYIDEYLEGNPEDKKALAVKARILQSLGRQEDAASYYEQLDDDPDLNQDAGALTDMAEAYFQSGNREKAVGKLESLLNLQGTSGRSEDFDQLTNTLELYEKTVASFEAGSENWHNNLNKMRQIAMRDMNPGGDTAYTAGPRAPGIPLEEEDAVSLLDINAMEPVIKINEEEDTLILEENSEDMEDVYTELMNEGLIPGEDEEEIAPPPEMQQPPYYPPPPPDYYPPETPIPEDPYLEGHPEFQDASEPGTEHDQGSEETPHPPRKDDLPAEDPLGEDKEPLNIAGMMNYLFELSHDLPEEKKQVLIDKAIPLKMASVIKRLSGGKQFKEKVSVYDRRRGRKREFNIDRSKMKSSLSVFRNLTEHHPDTMISSAFTKKMDELMQKIKPYL